MTESLVNEAKWLVTHLLELNNAAAQVEYTMRNLGEEAFPNMSNLREQLDSIKQLRERSWSWHHDAKRLVDKLQKEV